MHNKGHYFSKSLIYRVGMGVAAPFTQTTIRHDMMMMNNSGTLDHLIICQLISAIHE